MMQGSLAVRLQALRARQGLTLTEASEQLGINRHTLSRLEAGTQRPYGPTLKKLAEGYGVPVEALIEEREAPKAQASPSLPPAEAVDEERRSQIIRDFLFHEERFGDLPAQERIQKLKRWCEHFENLRNRRRLDRDNLFDRSMLAYGRAMEMYALDEIERKRYFAEGVHTHTERVTRKELEVSEEEWELCWRVNKAMGDAQNLTGEVRELVQEREDALERDMEQGMERFLEEDVMNPRLKPRA
jgi:transcriptional regulator with XRE-family HTH domain